MLGLLSGPLGKIARLSRRRKRAILLISDGAAAALALLVLASIVAGGLPASWSQGHIAVTLPVAAALGLAASAAFGLHRVKPDACAVRAILRTTAMAATVTLCVAMLASAPGLRLAGAGIVLFGLVFFLLMLATRMAMLQTLLWVLRRGRPCSRVPIYGAGTTGVQLAAVAFVDDDPALHGLSVGGLRIFASDRLSALAQRLGANRVILAMPSVAGPRQAQIARHLTDLDLAVMSVPSFARLVGAESLDDALTPVVPDRFLGRGPMTDVPMPGAVAYCDRVVLVTGAGGSVGFELCRQLLAMRPRRLVLFEISEIALFTVERDLRELARGTETEIVPLLGSVTDAWLVRAAMTGHGVEVVLHAAAYKHVALVEANPVAGLSNNVLGTRLVAEAATEAGVRRFVLISTDKAVRPVGVMGASKRMAELVIQDMARRSGATAFSIVRFGNVLGSSGSVVPLFRDQIARGGPVTLTHEDVTRYFMTIGEAARLVLLAGSLAGGSPPRGADTFVLDMGKPVRIRDLAVQMIRAAGLSVRDAANPGGEIEIAVTGLRPGEKLHEELLIGEGLLATPHPRILRAPERSLPELQAASMLRALRAAVAAGDATAARRVIHDHVEAASPKPDLARAL